MSELQYPVTWEPPDDPRSMDESDCMAHIYEPTDRFPGDRAIARVFDSDHARRITAALNATAGIPTSDLEAGVVVVPVEEARLAADAVSVYLSMGFQVTQAEIERMKRFLARLQNVETPSETRITATIDVQTYRGYRDRRVIEVEPGIGWADRLGLEVQRAAQEMEEFHLNGPSKQNGGADHD